MNKRIKELASQAGQGEPFHIPPEFIEKFAEVIIREHINLLLDEWYELNNTEVPEEKYTALDLRFSSGRKSEIVVLIQKIKQHFEVK